MKKILALITTSVLLLCVFGCAKAKTSIYSASYFLDTPQNLSVANVNEKNTYSVSYAQTENENTVVVSVDSQNSTYNTVLTNSTYNETACYQLETTLKIVGEIDNQGVKTPINDSIKTKTYFLGVDSNLKPLYSERIVKTNSIVRTSPVNATARTYKVCYYDYVIKTEYETANAKVSLTVNEKPSDDTKFNSYSNHEFFNIENKTAYVDNDMLTFSPRAMALNSATSKSFYTIDAVSLKNHKMKLTSVSGEPTKTIKLDGYYNNGTKVSEVLCYAVSFAIDSNASGTSTVCYYADVNNKNERAKLISATTTASYGLGTFTYSIIETKRI